MNNTRTVLPIRAAHKNEGFILPNAQVYGLDDRDTKLNSNVMIVGTSGGGKTYKYVRPNIEAMVGNYIVADTKGLLSKTYRRMLERNGYNVKIIDFIHPEQSAKYNPIAYVSDPDEVIKLSHQIVSLSFNRGRVSDPFWDQAAEMLLSAMIGYIAEGGVEVGTSFSGVFKLISLIDVDEWENSTGKTKLEKVFLKLDAYCRETYYKPSWSYEQLMKFSKLARKTMSCVVVTLQNILQSFDTYGIRDMMSGSTVDFSEFANGKTAIFVNISDIDRSKDLIANIFYTQAMSELCRIADEECEDNRLPVPVRFILDDFGTNCRISGFENMISNIRSRRISASVILQDTSQLFAGYGDSAQTIISDCDTIVYMGGNDTRMATMISRRGDIPEAKILNMPVDTSYTLRRGEAPVFSPNAHFIPRQNVGFIERRDDEHAVNE